MAIMQAMVRMDHMQVTVRMAVIHHGKMGYIKMRYIIILMILVLVACSRPIEPEPTVEPDQTALIEEMEKELEDEPIACKTIVTKTRDDCVDIFKQHSDDMRDSETTQCYFEQIMNQAVAENDVQKCIDLSKTDEYQQYSDWTATLCYLIIADSCDGIDEISEIEDYPGEAKEACSAFFDYLAGSDISGLDSETKEVFYMLKAARNKDSSKCSDLTGARKIKCYYMSGETNFCKI